MCKCTPNIRTPYCGKPGCESPHPTRIGPQTTEMYDVSDAVQRLLSVLRRNGMATLVCAVDGKVVRVDDEVGE